MKNLKTKQNEFHKQYFKTVKINKIFGIVLTKRFKFKDAASLGSRKVEFRLPLESGNN